MEEMLQLIQEIIDDPPKSICADNGTSCAFCGAEYYYQRYWAGGELVIHCKDCWLVRAKEAIKGYL